MTTRPRVLPAGWYPSTQGACVKEIEKFVAGVEPLPPNTKVFGGIVPHAGWYFSGKLAARVFYLTSLVTQPQVVCVFGGHLDKTSPPLLVTEDAWETPMGNIPIATEIHERLTSRVRFKAEYPGDNTIEVQLPFVKHFFPKAKLLALRAPHSPMALQVGEAVATVAQEMRLSLLAFGSTDLTHYGPNYGWAPKGYGLEAVKWVREVNDKDFLEQALKLDGNGMLLRGALDQSACSAGGAAAAAAAAKKLGAARALLVDYYTSYDIQPGDSFVGYAGIIMTG